ncbi:unnamed protein product [Moneuplotes crassus]|uniref:C2H2-type domain-containing protein n=1 Tax=Euplotes crassus TaxID=5936 RepID=A0AAD1U0S5_EUPCR|nr:unnamed protein product [Moneuplotes crassus]
MTRSCHASYLDIEKMSLEKQKHKSGAIELPISNDYTLALPSVISELIISNQKGICLPPPVTSISKDLSNKGCFKLSSFVPQQFCGPNNSTIKKQSANLGIEETKEATKLNEDRLKVLKTTDEIKVSGGSLKRRNNKYRDVREMKDYSPTRNDIDEEKRFLMKQYGLTSNMEDFDISYIPSEKFDKKKRVFLCSYEGCGRSFCKTWNLFDHLRIHTKEKPFKCKVCGRGFAQNGNLTKHERVHLKVDRRKYKCNICPKAYTEKYNLKIHKLKIHGIRAD